ncbi:cytochrome P450 52A11 [Colletotrichum sojae]|uniref:Cytochrome P450 52A11 n=1 Tax=Colletotrichum sojae TaxID=2175907 RepID=A0A8H6IP45_9PEZI|nr:cytochrome P450 52A11 [Colletotrichum sojae]
MLSGSVIIALLALPALLFYLYSAIHYRRLKQFAHFPQLKPSFVWGHMRMLTEYQRRRGETGSQLEHTFGDMFESIGNPPVMFLDIRPASRPMLVIRSHEVAEQITKQSKMWPYSLPKSNTLQFLYPLFGETSIVMVSGPEWRDMRKRFNPGFAPHHLMGLMPVILEKTQIFIRKLNTLALTGEDFELGPLCTDLTFDIIGAVTMDVDLGAQLPQQQQGDFIKSYKKILLSYEVNNGIALLWDNALVHRRREALAKSANDFITDVILRRYDDVKQNRVGSNQSVLALSLKDVEYMTSEILIGTRDQLKTFLFAGHDTTSILLQWALYELSRTPRALATLRAELKSLFGPDLSPESVQQVLLSRGEEVMVGMSYTSAVIKETLRLYPPAGTARWCAQGSNFYLQLPGADSLCVDDLILYICPTLVQRDPAVYGSTKDDFVPERWLGNTDTSSSPMANEKVGVNSTKAGENEIPAAAWRPFERGPRNCIGQELANIEARVILASVVGSYDFEKVGLGEAILGMDGRPLIDEKGQHRSATRLINTRQITSKPIDGMRVRVKYRGVSV